jgi:hypothetical protein
MWELILNYRQVNWLKEYTCVQVGDHRNIGKTIADFQKNGWKLHTYACAGIGTMMAINHYLLFERGD